MNSIDNVSSGAIVVIRDKLLQMQASGKNVFRLESGDPSFDVSAETSEAITMALKKGYTHYTASAGVEQLRNSLFKKCSLENKFPMNGIQDITITSGGMHALYLTFMSILNSGDEVIIPDPMWTEIGEIIRLSGGTPVRVPLKFTDSPYDPNLIESHITSRTKAIFINTPHNPTGIVLSRSNLLDILAIAEKYNLTVISDEAYEHLTFNGVEHVSFGSLAGAYSRTVSIFSTSKSYAMSGLRVGYIVSDNKVFQERVRKLLRCTTNGVNSIAQYGVIAAIEKGSQHIQSMKLEYEKRRNVLVAALISNRVFIPVMPKGTFFVWAKLSWTYVTGRTNADWDATNSLIEKYGIGSAPGSAFGAPGSSLYNDHIRFSFSGKTDMIEQASNILENAIL